MNDHSGSGKLEYGGRQRARRLAWVSVVALLIALVRWGTGRVPSTDSKRVNAAPARLSAGASPDRESMEPVFAVPPESKPAPGTPPAGAARSGRTKPIPTAPPGSTSLPDTARPGTAPQQRKPARAPGPAGKQPRPTYRLEPAVENDRFWLNAHREVDRSVLEILRQHQDELDRGVHWAKVMHGDRRVPQVAITFDDGPHPQYTPRLLAVLKQYNVKATFFLVGELAEKYPDLVRAEIAAGHSVGNHTYHHVNLTKVPADDIATEIKACGQVLQTVTGRVTHLFRPPGGDYNQRVAQTAVALGYRIVLWTDDPGDYASPGATVIQKRLLDRVGNGGIILIHDGIQQTIDVLPQIIQALRAKGYQFVTIDQLAAGRNDREGAAPR